MNNRPKKDIDYYIDENGNYVFTAEMLKKRGRCCYSKCKNCPYGTYDETKEDTDDT